MLSPAEILDERCVLLDMNVRRKRKVVSRLVDALAEVGVITDPRETTREVLEREKRASAGIGRGVAIPHRLTDTVAQTVMAFGRTRDGVSFGAIDGRPVGLVFLILGPADRPNEHLQLLSRLSRLFHRDECVKRLLEARTAADVRSVLQQEEGSRPRLPNGR